MKIIFVVLLLLFIHSTFSHRQECESGFLTVCKTPEDCNPSDDSLSIICEDGVCLALDGQLKIVDHGRKAQKKSQELRDYHTHADDNLIVNGGFEEGSRVVGGQINGWESFPNVNLYVDLGEKRKRFLNRGHAYWSPYSGQSINQHMVPSPPQGQYAAVTVSYGGFWIGLYQDFLVPPRAELDCDIVTFRVSFQMWYNNEAYEFYGTDFFQGGANDARNRKTRSQVFRADILNPKTCTNVYNIYGTKPGDNLVLENYQQVVGRFSYSRSVNLDQPESLRIRFGVESVTKGIENERRERRESQNNQRLRVAVDDVKVTAHCLFPSFSHNPEHHLKKNTN